MKSLPLSSTIQKGVNTCDILTFLAAAPLGLRVVGRGVLVSHGCLYSVIHCSTSVNRGISIYTAASLVPLVLGLTLHQLHQVLIDRYLLALSAQLHLHSLIIGMSHPSSVALEPAHPNDHCLTHEWVFTESILGDYSLAS